MESTQLKRVLSKLSIFTSSHFITSGPGTELEAFLRDRTSYVACMFHPFYFSRLRHTFVNIYVRGQLESRLRFRTLPRFGVLNYTRDFILSLVIPLRLKRRFDFYIGSNPLNAFVGIIMQRLGFARWVIFYKIDYVPIRFSNRMMNALYNQIDRLSSRYSDWTWNLAQPMIDERLRRGISLGKQLVVPIGTNFERIQRMHSQDKARNKLVYMGSLRAGQGIELAIEAFPRIKATVPDTELLIVGSGPLASKLKDRVSELGLGDYVSFTGEVPDHSKVEQILTGCHIGLAPYEPSEDNFTQFTEPGKVKVYLACGLPVIITKVPKIAEEIEKRGAGLLISYDSLELSEAVRKLSCDKEAYASARSAAIAFASEYEWTSVFARAFGSMLDRTSTRTNDA